MKKITGWVFWGLWGLWFAYGVWNALSIIQQGTSTSFPWYAGFVFGAVYFLPLISLAGVCWLIFDRLARKKA